jgi:hypothetical protein
LLSDLFADPGEKLHNLVRKGATCAARLPIKNLLLATLAVAVTTHASTANAQTASGEAAGRPAPVSITYVRVADLKSDEARRGTIYLSFHNNGTVVADEVRFTVRQGQTITEVRDTGLFSPKVRIDHRLAGGHTLQWSAGSWSSAAVVYIHFIDGTSWSDERLQARS